MGIQDCDRLIELQNYANSFPGFHFKVDLGDYETAIEFKIIVPPLCKTGDSQIISICPPIAKDWIKNSEIFCPDLLDYNNKKIIEYEEETGNRRSGARLAKKGHGHPGDLANIRDSRRNSYYENAGFKFLQIWESDKDWMEKINQFLSKSTVQ